MTDTRNRNSGRSDAKPAAKKREDALKDALRANLQRRKSQARARRAEGSDKADSGNDN